MDYHAKLLTLFLLLSLFSCQAAENSIFFPDEQELLSSEQAFQVETSASYDRLYVDFRIADGYYLYQQQLNFVPQSAGLRLHPPLLPPALEKEDPFFGKVAIYRQQMRVELPVSAWPDKADPLILKLSSQGCADIGVCYPPRDDIATIARPLKVAAAASVAAAQNGSNNLLPSELSEQQRIAQTLAQSTPFALLLLFGLGLLLAFTPCVFPMVPILSGIITGQREKLSTSRAFLLSLTYVLAMALSYAAAGAVVAMLGVSLQASLQSPWVLAAVAALFVLLSLSMFGLFEVQLPAALRQRLDRMATKQKGGHFVGVAILGMLSAIVVSPCVTPPLIGVLLFISQTQDILLGSLALFVLALGMGVPLLAFGSSIGALLPRVGPWMENLRRFFGVLLLATAIWLLERILPEIATMLLSAALLVVSAIYIGALEPIPVGSSGWRRLAKGCGLLLLVYGILLLTGAAIGGGSLLQPIRGLQAKTAFSTTSTMPTFLPVATLQELSQHLQQNKGPVMLDFYADWCVSCKEMESFTFPDPAVQQNMRSFLLLQADVTNNTAADQELLQHFSIFGPPALLFFDPNGNEIRNRRVVGFLSAKPFAEHLRGMLQDL